MVASAALILAAQTLFLYLMGRPLICPCATLTLWQGTLDPIQNSQQVADPYSLLHVTLGLVLYRWLSWIRPGWSFLRTVPVVLISSAIWELVENMPMVVELFGAAGSDLHYVGDSLVNSLADSLFVVVGAAAASVLAPWITLVAVVAIELVVVAMIGDSILLGAVRLLFTA